MNDKYTRETFMNELDKTIWWEQLWVKFNQNFSISINQITWIARFLLLALATYQIKMSEIQTWVILSIAVLSMLNVTLPLLSVTFKFQQRLELHDRIA